MSDVFALNFFGPEEELFVVAEKLGFITDMDALSVMLFENPDGQQQVQALFNTQNAANLSLNSLDLSHNVTHEIVKLPEIDWVAHSQAGLAPIEAGRFWIYGQHDADRIPKSAEVPVCVEAGLAFGSGHHGTTKGCLVLLDRLLAGEFNPDTILDLGTGAGILAISAAKTLPKAFIIATDIDQDAVDTTITNAELNSVADNIVAFQADGLSHPRLETAQFEFVLANILAGPLIQMSADISAVTKHGGLVMLSGMLDEQSEQVVSAFLPHKLQEIQRISVDGWTSVILRNETN